MDFEGSVSLDDIQSFQPTPVSAPFGGSGGGSGFGGRPPVSLNIIPAVSGGRDSMGGSISSTRDPASSDVAPSKSSTSNLGSFSGTKGAVDFEA
jgi:hypothetical protein